MIRHLANAAGTLPAFLILAGCQLSLGAGSGSGVAAGVGVNLSEQATAGAPGSPEANCMHEIGWRSGGSARLVKVTPTESGVTLVEAAGFWGVRYTCFADPDGKVVRVIRRGAWD
jgi:catechol 2,3-dioxygenase-like lactoylglutathione lyase family enzyme